MRGSEFHDEIYFNKKTGFYRDTNNAGGLEGGMTNGEPIDVRITFKPIPTVLKGLKSVNIKNKSAGKSLKERSDICAVPSAAVVAEAMLAIEITEAVMDKFGRDSIEEIVENYKNYKEFIKSI
jgi:chorismate synthase